MLKIEVIYFYSKLKTINKSNKKDKNRVNNKKIVRLDDKVSILAIFYC